MSDLKVGDEYVLAPYGVVVDGVSHGVGTVLGFQGRREGLREWLNIIVGVTPGTRVLVKIRDGEVTQ